MNQVLNIAGSEWLIIILAVLVLLLGTNKLPEAARKIGKIVSEFEKAKKEITNQVSGLKDVGPSKPVETEREKLDIMARTLGITHKDKTDDELRELIANKVGKRTED